MLGLMMIGMETMIGVHILGLNRGFDGKRCYFSGIIIGDF